MNSAEPDASRIGVGDTLSHYRISAILGEGGMGVVYRARDERLKRDVAVKILTAAHIDDIARRRFRNEALALSKLNHPNIQIVHDFDSDRGLDFLVTEYVGGLSLRESLTGGALPIREVVDLGTQLADGLAAAHARGITHRDLKPENLKVTPEGRLKILDFGIARMDAVHTESLVSVTTDFQEKDVIVGTVPYMAPEQLRGDETDGRTDIFAAGCVLYEMCTGRRAFGETVMPRLIDAILNHTPVLDRTVPAPLRRIIAKCLQKKPQDRYQTAAELGAELRKATGRAIPWRAIAVAAAAVVVIGIAFAAIRLWPAAERTHAIAVIPLQNLSGDPSQEYFADGMTDALITDLGRFGVDRVIARGSMMQYKGTKKSLPDVARELKVDAIVTGAVVRDGNRIRVTAELIDPKTQTQMWSERYEADLRNVLGLQSDLASAIASKVERKLARNQKAPRVVRPDAFDAYMKAMALTGNPSPNELALRMDYLKLAVQKDPEFAEAHAAIAGTWAARIVFGFTPPRDAVVPARAEAMRALEIDSQSAEAHLALAVVKTYMEWDWAGAEREFRRAVVLNPTSPDIHFQYATFLGPVLGRFDDWKIQMDRCLALDPLSSFYRFFRARQLMTLGKPEESIAALKKVQEQAPDFPLIHDGLWFAYEAAHQYDLALPEAVKAFERKGDAEVVRILRDGAGNYPFAIRRAAEALEKRSATTYVAPGLLARMYAYGGEREKAIALLQRSFETHDQGLLTLQHAPAWNSLRSDPRFQQLVRQMKYPAQDFGGESR